MSRRPHGESAPFFVWISSRPIAAPRLTATRARQGTYSIVARDPDTGEMGAAVQSHWFSVGPIVPWARAGVGAVATQASAELSYGPRGLELMAQGTPAPDALARLLAEDELRASRQVAFVDAAGRVAAHTGDACMPDAGDVQGTAVSCQANIMANPRVWPAMLAAFQRHTGSLTARLLAALDAAEAEGGDLRGRQSAAIIVVPAAGRAVGHGRLAARRGPPGSAARAGPARAPARRLRRGRPGRRTSRRGRARGGRGALPARLRDGPGVRRAALLGRRSARPRWGTWTPP